MRKTVLKIPREGIRVQTFCDPPMNTEGHWKIFNRYTAIIEANVPVFYKNGRLSEHMLERVAEQVAEQVQNPICTLGIRLHKDLI